MSYRSESVERRWLERLQNLTTKQGSEHAERFTQSTDGVKNELTGESVHVGESAMTVTRRVPCRLFVVCSLLPASCFLQCSVLRESRRTEQENGVKGLLSKQFISTKCFWSAAMWRSSHNWRIRLRASRSSKSRRVA